MGSWAQLLSSGLIAIVSAFGVAVFYIGPQRKKYLAEASGTDVTSASTLSGAALAQMNAAIAATQRAEAKAEAADRRADEAEHRVDELERQLRREQSEVRAVKYEVRDLRDFLASPAVAALLNANGLHPPPHARLTHDSQGDDHE